MSGQPLALYVHIPFCEAKCVYCDFASFAGKKARIPAYLSALEAELLAQASAIGARTVRSVFFGGGTPTLLSGAQVAALMSAVRACFPLAADAEITMEGNPGTLRAADVAGYRAAGVNRVSLGAQAAQPRLLAALGRIHRWRDVEAGVALLRAEGFDNINLDLMFGLPGQRDADWRETLDAALALAPEHLSCYGLQVEEGTPLAARIAAGEGEPLPDEDAERAMYAEARRAAAQAGLEQYELSNFAKPGRACRQNLTYWRRGDYLGIGSAAHSLVGDVRWGNTPDLDAYLAALREGASPAAERGEIDAEEARFEAVMLGLRLTQGVSLVEFAARYGATAEAVWGAKLEALIRDGLLERSAGWLRLTDRGMDVQNAVLVELMGV